MGYVSAKFPEAISVKGIYTVFRREFDGRTVFGHIDVHDFPEIIYVRSGCIFPLVDGIQHTVRAGQMLIYAPNSPHTGKKASEASVSIISFDIDGGLPAEIYNRPITLNSEQERMLESVINDGFACFTKRPANTGLSGMILRDDVDEYILYRMKRELELFLVGILGQKCKKSYSEHLSEYETVIRLLRQKIYCRLTVEAIAEESKMSVSKLKYLFRENFGGGVIDCFNKIKMEEAKRLIKEGKYNLTEISDRLAFSSLHYFSRMFKKIVGMSPSEFAKKADKDTAV
ncbi:MAG: AraC family transcriptional regulator [Ruminococcaceae bacterium]|nr:AraC family transcriptional regulator [Oscillospiraceae bacterium]